MQVLVAQRFFGADSFEPALISKGLRLSQRYYVSLYAADQTLKLCVPLVGSTDSNNISLVAGYFTSTLVFRISSQSFEVSP